MLARSYHLAMMPGVGRRARLLVDWNIGLLFGRDTAELGRLGGPRSLAAPPAGDEDGRNAVRRASSPGRVS
jgi:NADH dehydrogenase